MWISSEVIVYLLNLNSQTLIKYWYWRFLSKCIRFCVGGAFLGWGYLWGRGCMEYHNQSGTTTGVIATDAGSAEEGVGGWCFLWSNTSLAAHASTSTFQWNGRQKRIITAETEPMSSIWCTLCFSINNSLNSDNSHDGLHVTHSIRLVCRGPLTAVFGDQRRYFPGDGETRWNAQYIYWISQRISMWIFLLCLLHGWWKKSARETASVLDCAEMWR